MEKGQNDTIWPRKPLLSYITFYVSFAKSFCNKVDYCFHQGTIPRRVLVLSYKMIHPLLIKERKGKGKFKSLLLMRSVSVKNFIFI